MARRRCTASWTPRPTGGRRGESARGLRRVFGRERDCRGQEGREEVTCAGECYSYRFVRHTEGGCSCR
jgi:hypothetical protein